MKEEIKPMSEAFKALLEDIVRKAESNGLNVPEWVEEYGRKREPRS